MFNRHCIQRQFLFLKCIFIPKLFIHSLRLVYDGLTDLRHCASHKPSSCKPNNYSYTLANIKYNEHVY